MSLSLPRNLLLKTSGLNALASRFLSTNTRFIDPIQSKYLSEECLLVDPSDKVIGSASKRICHQIVDPKQAPPLHRAFSVFLFNSENKLLLQKRAQEKITFPGVWTNTCCSHPLDTAEEREEAGELGVRRAALRKLDHELGLSSSELKVDSFRYLTRIHYEATNPIRGEWGEHEIDYILFAKGDFEINPNPNEVEDVRYVHPSSLEQMVKEHSFSPWFRLVADSHLKYWWENLDHILENGTDSKFSSTIHKLS